jgi:carotenoid cleavage dioxygenase-like enzyme
MNYRPGFTTLTDETTVDALPVKGALPEWLAGTLVRNGPAMFDHAGKSFRHWFDGQAMLHRFGFAGGTVSYTNKLLDTPASRALREQGRIGYGEFATDPCGSLFGRFFTRFTRKPSANASVNVTHLDGKPVAITEVPLAVEFDPSTLETLGVMAYADGIEGAITTAHPHADPDTGDLINYVLRYGRTSRYQVYRQPAGSAQRVLIGSVAADRPGYLHSFAVTRRYAILMIFPFVVNPLSFLLRGRPFIENYRWRPELGTRIAVLDLADGTARGEYTAPPCFGFHHINAYDDGDDAVIDLCAFPDAKIIKALYLDELRAGAGVPMALPTRYRVPVGRPDRPVEVTVLAEEPLELSRINYTGHNGRPYRYAYGVGAADRTGADFLDQLCKLDVSTGDVRIWREDGCYPGEPVFVAAPEGAGKSAEDNGVVLSLVLDSASDRSFLLVLDAVGFTELARAEVPHPIPFGFHGQFSATGSS